MSSQEIVFAFIEIGMFVNLEIGRIAKDHINLTTRNVARKVFQIVMNDLHLLVKLIELDGALRHICQPFLDLNSNNLSLSVGTGK